MSKKEKIWLSLPHMGGEEQRYVKAAFDANWIAPVGEHIDEFEKSLQRYVGVQAAGVFTSGTASIHLALMILGIGVGDEVLCQSFTFSGSANPIRYTGAVPVFIDSEPTTWNMDPLALETAIKDRITKGTLPKAVLAVDLYGMPAKMEAIKEVAKRYDLPVIEDAAEALGSSIDGRKCGSFGKLNILSFNGNKIITTSGGGALLGESQEMIEKARYLSTQARDAAPHYQHSVIGYNYRMSNVLAGIGRGQMEVLDERVRLRRAVHERYFQALGETWLDVREGSKGFKHHSKSPTGITFLKEPEGYHSNRWLSTIIVNHKETGGVTREDIRLALEKEIIEARPLWKPMHQQPVFSGFPFYTSYHQSAISLSGWLFEHGLCLPSGSNMTEGQQQRVIDVILDLVG